MKGNYLGSPKWKLVMWKGFEYAKCFGQMYRCTTKEIYERSNVNTWVWIPQIKRYVNCVSIG